MSFRLCCTPPCFVALYSHFFLVLVLITRVFLCITLYITAVVIFSNIKDSWRKMFCPYRIVHKVVENYLAWALLYP
jgi:hypothetical protein